MTGFTRRKVLALGGGALSVVIAGRTGAQERGTLRIGTVVPSKTGELAIQASINDYLGDGARMGVLLAEAIVSEAARGRGLDVAVLMANSPNAAAAFRAGQRLVRAEGVDVLIGGIGPGQAAALAEVAEDAGVPFFNIGTTDATLRDASCHRFTFHIEASDEMYLDAIVEWSARQNLRRLFVVHDNTQEGIDLEAQLRHAIDAFEGAEIVGAASVAPEQPYYSMEFDAAEESGADAILLLLDAADQIYFLAQMENLRERLPVIAFPETLTQTRDYIAAARYMAPAANPRHRLALWETTLSEGTAGNFNETFRARWGEPANPTAWAAYHAVKIAVETALATGATDGETFVTHLQSPEAQFDVGKTMPASFRSSDHQLRQPLYVIRVDQESPWSQMSLSNRIGIAEIADEIAYHGDPGSQPAPSDCVGITRESRLRGSNRALQGNVAATYQRPPLA